MRVLIWIKASEAVKNDITQITEYHHDWAGCKDCVQVSLTADEYAELVDLHDSTDQWIIDQYNRNREHEDKIESIDEMSDQNNQPFAD